MAARKKRKSKAPEAPSNPALQSGANRRAVAVLTKKLADDLEKIEEQKKLLGKHEARLLNTYKKDTGRSKRATKRALAFYRMEDSIARDTEIGDQIDVMKDLGMGNAMPLFKEAATEAALAADLERESATPGFIQGLGRQAFADGVRFDEAPYTGPRDSDAGKARDKWETGWLAAQKTKEDAAAAKSAEKAAAKAAAATTH